MALHDVEILMEHYRAGNREEFCNYFKERLRYLTEEEKRDVIRIDPGGVIYVIEDISPGFVKKLFNVLNPNTSTLFDIENFKDSFEEEFKRRPEIIIKILLKLINSIAGPKW